jgi:hypothetical protein
MKFATVTLLFSLATALQLRSQCTEMQLNTLQVVQKAEPASKEAEILKLGFDLSSEQGTGAANVRKFVKCWHSNGPQGKSYFDQVVLWHTNTNTVTFLTLDGEAFSRLRKSVEERHPGSTGQQTVYGKMFRYTFVSQDVSGRAYQGLMVSLRNQ